MTRRSFLKHSSIEFSNWSIMTDGLSERSSSCVFPLPRLKLRRQGRTDDLSITLSPSPYTSFNCPRISQGQTSCALRNLIMALSSQLTGSSICLNIINDHRHNTRNAIVKQPRTEQVDKQLTRSDLVQRHVSASCGASRYYFPDGPRI